MISSGINLVMTVIGFLVSTMFIVFVCTRLIWARIQLSASRRSLARTSRSDLTVMGSGLHGLEAFVVSKLPMRKYKELCLSLKENTQCTICLSEYHQEDILKILPICGHSFHATCIDIWLQQHSTCPVCRISLRELPQKKWFMQPMFCSASRPPQYSMQHFNPHYCYCMANNERRAFESHNNQTINPMQSEEEGVATGDRICISVDSDHMIKNLERVET